MNRVRPVLIGVLIALPSAADSGNGRFATAINDFYHRQPPLCLGETQWPIPARAASAPWESGRLAALVEAGLAVKKDGQFVLTPTGAQNWQRYGDLCYGRMAVSRIERVERLSATTFRVYFSGYLVKPEKWASHPSLRHAFSELDNVLSGEKQSLWVATVRQSAGQARVQDYPVPDELEY